MGSVKELKAYRQPTPARSGIGQFVFSDRYSVFDWGEMPDRIEGKGASLCVMAAHFFEILGREGIPNHFLGLGDGYDIKLLTGLMEPSTRMMVKLFRVVRPGTAEGSYDYSAYRSLSSNFLIPLEVIYRNVLPAGSSVFRRLEEGTLSAADLGLSGPPEPGQVLERPFIEVSTKLESTDRYISWDEARSISCLTIDETDRIRELTLRINEIISAEAARAGLASILVSRDELLLLDEPTNNLDAGGLAALTEFGRALRHAAEIDAVFAAFLGDLGDGPLGRLEAHVGVGRHVAVSFFATQRYGHLALAPECEVERHAAQNRHNHVHDFRRQAVLVNTLYCIVHAGWNAALEGQGSLDGTETVILDKPKGREKGCQLVQHFQELRREERNAVVGFTQTALILIELRLALPLQRFKLVHGQIDT